MGQAFIMGAYMVSESTWDRESTWDGTVWLCKTIKRLSAGIYIYSMHVFCTDYQLHTASASRERQTDQLPDTSISGLDTITVL